MVRYKIRSLQQGLRIVAVTDGLVADQVAVPDYPSGATEHWGLITYRESRLLYDPEQVGDQDKQRVAAIVAHELVHNVSGLLKKTLQSAHCKITLYCAL